MKHWQILTALLSCLSGVGCVNAPYIGTDDMARVIERDASNLNEAHARATNALILQNILRARDRWPTHYTTLGGIKVDPEATVTAGVSLGPLGLGNPPGPFTDSAGNLSQATKAKTGYAINPFSTDTERAESIYKPVPKIILQHYWNGNWPKDVLAYLFINSVKSDGKWIPNDGENPGDFSDAISGLLSEEKDIRMRQIERDAPRGCPVIYKGLVESLVTDVRSGDLHKTSILTQISTLKELSNNKLHIDYTDEEDSPSHSKDIEAQYFVVKACAEPSEENNWRFVNANDEPVASIEEFKLRSFDGMIYFVGETVRNELKMVDGYCPSGEKKDANIFKIYSDKDEDKPTGVRFSAKVRYAGQTFYAAPRIEPGDESDHFCSDRSGTVLAILSQLFLLNQSPEFLKAPEDTFIER